MLSVLIFTLLCSSCTEQKDDILEAEVPLTETHTFTQEELEEIGTGFIEQAKQSTDPPICWIHLYATEDVIAPSPPENAHLEMFAELSEHRQQFHGNVIDDNFRILRHLTATQNYIKYLQDTFPKADTFETLSDFWKIPDGATVQDSDVFTGILENPTNEQLEYISHHVLTLKCTHQALIYLFSVGCRNGQDPSQQGEPGFVTENKQVIIGRLDGYNLHWLFNLAQQKSETLIERYHTLAKDAIDADKQKIRGFFNEYGVNNGLIWLAIQEPDITGMFLSNFRDPFLFQSWVNLSEDTDGE